MNEQRLFFSLKGVDITDDDALAALAIQVREQATERSQWKVQGRLIARAPRALSVYAKRSRLGRVKATNLGYRRI